MSRERRPSPTGSHRTRRSRITRAALAPAALSTVLVAALAVSLTGCGESRGDAQHDLGEPRPVTLAEVVMREGPADQSYAGEVVAANRFDVASKAMGNVAELPVTEGTMVTRGDLIARIDAPELTTALARARAEESAAKIAMDTAVRHADRFRRLAKEGVVTARDLEVAEMEEATAKAMHEGALAQRTIAERNMAYAVIRAPFDGIVVDRLVRLGDLATPGRPLAVLEDAVREIRVSVPAERGPVVVAGDEVRVLLPSGESIAAHVDRVTPDASRHVREIYVRAPELDLPSGTFVTIGVAGAADAPSLVLPPDALRRRGSLTSVFVAKDDRAVLRYVRLDDHGHVVAGLEAGERVIVSPPSDLRDGDPITASATRAPGEESSSVTSEEVPS